MNHWPYQPWHGGAPASSVSAKAAKSRHLLAPAPPAMLRNRQFRLRGARTDDPLLSVLQDPLCRAGQRDRADRAQGALRRLPPQLVPGSGRRSTSAAARRPSPRLRRADRAGTRRHRRRWSGAPTAQALRRAWDRGRRATGGAAFRPRRNPARLLDDRSRSSPPAADAFRAVVAHPDLRPARHSASGSASRCRPASALASSSGSAEPTAAGERQRGARRVAARSSTRPTRSSACPQIRAELQGRAGPGRLQLVDRAAGAASCSRAAGVRSTAPRSACRAAAATSA